MTDLAGHDRPREKLERAGAPALGDNELVAMVIGRGSVRASALELANRMLELAGGLHGLTRLTRDQLASTPGVGATAAGRVMAAIELGRRTLTRLPTERPRLTTPEETARYLLPLYGAYPVEQFGVLMLDTRHRLIRTRLLSIGSLDRSLVHPREVFREATAAGAASIVVFHNHPSGDPSPSTEDYALTRRLVSAGYLMGIPVEDHLILADAKYCSLRHAGQM